MTKLYTLLAMAVLGFAVMAATTTNSDAQATKPCPKSGYCPAGTCAKDGSNKACNIANCKKENCPDKSGPTRGYR